MEQNKKTTSILSFRPLSRNLEKNKASLFPGHRIKSGMTEGGRSMVEMLGVLAIIGVISIGAIAGYTYGMNRYRTNEILDGGNKRAYTISTQDSLGIPYNLSEYRDYNVTAGGTFGDTNTIQDWDGEFGLTVTGVSKDVCENLIRMMGDKSTLRAITKTSDEKTDLASGDCASPTNDLYLVYNKDMAAEDSTNSGRSASEVSSTSSSSLSSAEVTYPRPSYCESNDCDTRYANDGTTPIGTSLSDMMTWDNAIDACGDRGMYTMEELGCDSSQTTSCSIDGYYWLADYDEDYMYYVQDGVVQWKDRYTDSDFEYDVLCK